MLALLSPTKALAEDDTTNKDEPAALATASPKEAGLPEAVMPSFDSLSNYLSELNERDKGRALNVLADLAADERLEPAAVARVLASLVAEGTPAQDFGYYCPTCFQRRLSELLAPMRLKGPRVAPQDEGAFIVQLDDRFLRRLKQEALDEVGGNLTGLVDALLNGYDLAGKFKDSSWIRYHRRDGDPRNEPAFFTSQTALATYEAGLKEGLSAYSLARWSCLRPPNNRFEPGLLILSFLPRLTCTEVRIPTAADSENPYFRATATSEQRSGFTCGGAPEWVCPNVPLFEITGSRFVPNSTYLH